MELIDVLRGRWLYLAVAAPVIAGIAALTLLSAIAEQEFVATTTVPVPQSVGTDGNAASLRTLLEDFSNEFASREVAEATSDATGRSTESLLRSVQARPAGDGSDVAVSLKGSSSAEAVEEELLELSRAALTSITEARLDQAQLSLSAAERQLNETLVELQEIEEEAGTTDLLNEYRQRSADVQALRTEIARAFDSSALQGALQAVYEEKLAEQQDLAAVVTEWELRRNELTEASAARDAAERSQFSTENVLERVQSGNFGLAIDVDGTSATGDAMIPTLAAMIFALGAVVVLAMLSNRFDRPAALPNERERTPNGAPPDRERQSRWSGMLSGND